MNVWISWPWKKQFKEVFTQAWSKRITTSSTSSTANAVDGATLTPQPPQQPPIAARRSALKRPPSPKVVPNGNVGANAEPAEVKTDKTEANTEEAAKEKEQTRPAKSAKRKGKVPNSEIAAKAKTKTKELDPLARGQKTKERFTQTTSSAANIVSLVDKNPAWSWLNGTPQMQTLNKIKSEVEALVAKSEFAQSFLTTEKASELKKMFPDPEALLADLRRFSNDFDSPIAILSKESSRIVSMQSANIHG